MFGIGFTELLLVGLVALLVFGPERLPKIAREAALWIKKGKQMVGSVKDQIDRELEVQDLKRTLAEQKSMLDPTWLAKNPVHSGSFEPPKN